MPLSLHQNTYAISPGITASFVGNGGVEPYVYSLVSGGAGGSVNPTTGIYTPPTSVPENPAQTFATIQVTDSALATATASVLVGNALLLFCEILQREMGLASGRVYLWDQKIMQPSDNGLYIAVSVAVLKPIANINKFDPTLNQAAQSVTMQGMLDLDIISRGPAARDRKEQVLMALNSDYSQRQQDANSFYIAKHSTSFVNLSEIDGAAIPYRYRITVPIMYTSTRSPSTDYFDNVSEPVIVVDQ